MLSQTKTHIIILFWFHRSVVLGWKSGKAYFARSNRSQESNLNPQWRQVKDKPLHQAMTPQTWKDSIHNSLHMIKMHQWTVNMKTRFHVGNTNSQSPQMVVLFFYSFFSFSQEFHINDNWKTKNSKYWPQGWKIHRQAIPHKLPDVKYYGISRIHS